MTTIDTSSGVIKDTIMAYRSARQVKKVDCHQTAELYDSRLGLRRRAIVLKSQCSKIFNEVTGDPIYFESKIHARRISRFAK